MMKSIAFFNNKGGVGKTSLVYHLAWMMSDMGLKVLVADLDPQANLSSMFLTEDELDLTWNGPTDQTILDIVKPLMDRVSDIVDYSPRKINHNLSLIVGDLSLSKFEDALSENWPKCSDGDLGAFRVETAFGRAIKNASDKTKFDIVLIDVGPSLGAINRAALIASDFVVVPLSADLFAIKGLENVGPTLNNWRKLWSSRRLNTPIELQGKFPDGNMAPIGYVVSRYNNYRRGPVKAFQKWLEKAPISYRKAVYDQDTPADITIDNDPYRLALLKDYRSLMPMAQEARKPMFKLTPADGAIGAHQRAVEECHADFKALAERIVREIGIKQELDLFH
jgi:chromosome partitioning protein